MPMLSSIVALYIGFIMQFVEWLHPAIPLHDDYGTLSVVEGADAGMPPLTKSTILFTGDIMLARHVEEHMKTKGVSYPFLGDVVPNSWEGSVIGNFEGTVPVVHRKTPNFATHFSVASTALSELVSAGFTHVSLANNHAFDYGVDGFDNTKESLQALGITPFGDPHSVNESSIIYIGEGTTRVAVIAIHTLYDFKEEELAEILATASRDSEYQIAYVHWGTEYEKIPTAEVRAQATYLLHRGVDLIVGHHPHVVQSIETIDGKVVVYSLGNYIFDQYFSRDVMQGLVVAFTLTNEGSSLQLLPVTTEATPAQPRHMSEINRGTFLTELASISDPVLKQDITRGEIDLNSAQLASSTERVMMVQ